MNEKEKIDNLFQGLKALSESTFPKSCAACGKVYQTAEAFVRETECCAGGKSGLKSSCNDEDKPIVQLFRNCTCGSTLMDDFSDRRDASDTGLKRRTLFGQLLTLLIQKGVTENVARTELLKFVKGQPSSLLQKLGITIQQN